MIAVAMAEYEFQDDDTMDAGDETCHCVASLPCHLGNGRIHTEYKRAYIIWVIARFYSGDGFNLYGFVVCLQHNALPVAQCIFGSQLKILS